MPLRTIVNTNRAYVPLTPTHPQTNVTRTSGRRSLPYRMASGKTVEAVIIGPGSASGLKLMIPSFRMKGASVFILDNVPPATTIKQTGCYVSRWPAPQPTT